MIKLEKDEVHLWYLCTETPSGKTSATPEELEKWRSLLDEEEKSRAAQLKFGQHREQFLRAHAMVRQVLSSYAEVAPRDWSFSRNPFGRPAVANPGFTLSFSLSHCEGALICGISWAKEIGVDVEFLSERGLDSALWDTVLSAAEISDLKQLPAKLRMKRFFQFWTLKESYIKARGMGLSLPLEQISFTVKEEERTASVSFDPEMKDDPSTWQFHLFELSPHQVGSIAIRKLHDWEMKKPMKGEHWTGRLFKVVEKRFDESY